jgi:hypothetical protein
MLRAHGHEVIPINPVHATIEGLKVVASPSELPAGVHTISVYVGPRNLTPLLSGIVAARPKRIIANPGAESAELQALARAAGIDYVEACTLVMLSTGQF